MAYKYPICDVFHWFCKIARFFATEPKALLSAAGLLLSAGNALAAVASSIDVVGNLGFFSVLAGTIITYPKYVAFFMAIISLLALWVSGMLAKVSHKVEGAINAQGRT
jgi:hypothetical protein